MKYLSKEPIFFGPSGTDAYGDAWERIFAAGDAWDKIYAAEHKDPESNKQKKEKSRARRQKQS